MLGYEKELASATRKIYRLVRPIGLTNFTGLVLGEVMVSLAAEELEPAGLSASEAAFESLLTDIVSGHYAARLPAERELAQRLGASRATVRSALKRLESWRLVSPRRGSGVVVRDRREWSIEALPAFLRHSGDGDIRSMAVMLGDLLEIRRALIVSVLGLVAGRVKVGGLSRARAALVEAWACRHEGARFAEEDYEMMRAIVEAAGILPALWMLNDVAGIYLANARTWAGGLPPLDDYVEVHEGLFDALERGERQEAQDIVKNYLARHDARLLSVLEAFI